MKKPKAKKPKRVRKPKLPEFTKDGFHRATLRKIAKLLRHDTRAMKVMERAAAKDKDYEEAMDLKYSAATTDFWADELEDWAANLRTAQSSD